MIKKLRIKFILVSMLSILFVLVATMAAINVSNFIAIGNSAKNTINLVLENGFEDGPNEEPQPFDPNTTTNNGVLAAPTEPPAKPDERLLSELFFCVLFNENGEVEDQNYMHMFSLTNEECESMARDILAKKKASGSIDDYRYKKVLVDGKTKVAVVDVHHHIEQAVLALWASIIVAASAYTVLFVLIFFASKAVLKPSEDSYKKQKMFITNASHELKTPLTVISTDVEIIEMDHGESEWTKSIKDQVMLLTTMTNQLVTSARLEEGSDNYTKELFSLSEVAVESVEAFEPSFKNKGLTFHDEIEEGVMMEGNRYLINELFYIFFDNAMKYTKEGGDISVIVKRNKSNNKIEITFSNDVEEDNTVNVDQLFERFYRDPNTKVTGSGIGLSIYKQIVDLHKGKVNAKIENGKIYFFVIF